MFNRLRAFWPTSQQRGSLGKSALNDNLLKQAIPRRCPSTGFETAAFGLPHYFMNLFFSHFLFAVVAVLVAFFGGSRLLRWLTFYQKARKRLNLYLLMFLVRSCFPSPCLHGGRCERTRTGRRCVCADGYFGFVCESKGKNDLVNTGGLCWLSEAARYFAS